MNFEITAFLNPDDFHAIASTADDTIHEYVICNRLSQSVLVHRKIIYFYEVGRRRFVEVSPYTATALSSLLSDYVSRSRQQCEIDFPNELKKIMTKDKFSKKLLNYAPKKITNYALRLNHTISNDVAFNDDVGGIHFLNGRFDLPTGTFAERPHANPNVPSTIISKTLPYEYEAVSIDDWKALYTILLRGFGTEDDMQYVLYQFARALRGDVSECSCLFHVGQGGSGKSTLMKFVIAAVGDIYTHKLPSDVFDSAKSANRVLSEVPITARILLVSELDEKRKYASAVKCVCDGEIVTTKLYQGGAVTVRIHGKLFCTSNNLIVFDSNDSGISRRIQYCLHMKKFVDDDALVDNVNVLKNVVFDFDCASVYSKCTVFAILSHYATDTFTAPPKPETIMSFDAVFNIGAFLSMCFVSEEGATVSKSKVLSLAKSYYGTLLEYPGDLLIKEITNYSVSNGLGIEFDGRKFFNIAVKE